ncbi:MMS19 nucleotide excision repair protein homolog [Babylonia areolata]|uniref:MMS19 nucleotide excision repair protein homolog n=1 Tax=Babylonia areolata TaxID=304850 RepID=UPI003FD40A0E
MMATTTGAHVSDYVLGQDDSKAGDLARDLFERKITLVQVVEALGEYLTSQNVDHRRRGTRLMAEILQKLPSDFLLEKEVGHVTVFLLSKLNDHHSIQPFALHGLAAVTKFAGFCDAAMSRQVCTEIFKEVQNQSLSQGDRRATYTVFYNSLTLHLSDVLSLGDSFVCGYVQQMDGEKDPRNLMLAFRCSLIVCRNFGLGTMEEDMFEVNSCYFPVDFVPPPNDPHGITKEDLSEALCQVMTATPVFAQYCYPLLLEKLTSDITSAKLESLKTLKACLAVFESKDLQEFVGSFCSQLIKEVRAGSSEEMVAASLQALTGITAQLSRVPQQLHEFMAETGASLVRQVELDNLSVRLSAARILCAMASANGQVCHAVASRLVPAVCAVCQKMASQLEQHTAFFTEVVSLLQNVADAQNTIKDWSILQDWRSKLLETCDRLLASNDPQLQGLGMRGLLALMTWGAVFTTEEVAQGGGNYDQQSVVSRQ